MTTRHEADPLADDIARELSTTTRPAAPAAPSGFDLAVQRYERGELTSEKPAQQLDAALPVLKQHQSANVRPSGHLEFDEQDRAVALALQVDLEGSVDARISRAISAVNQAALKAVEAGYLLLNVKAEVGHGRFTEAVEAAGLSRQRASEMMQMAKVLTLAPEAQRTRLLEMPKSKVVELARADQAVVEVLLEEGNADKIDALTVRELRAEISSLKATLTDVTVQRDSAEAEVTTLKRSKSVASKAGRADGVPMMVAELRAEILALQEKSRLAIASLQEMARGTDGMRGTALDQWAEPTAQMGLAALCALHVQLSGAIESWVQAAGMTSVEVVGNILTRLTPAEVTENARAFDELAQVHAYESALRQWEREQGAPKGRGRPAAKPTPPAAVRADA